MDSSIFFHTCHRTSGGLVAHINFLVQMSCKFNHPIQQIFALSSIFYSYVSCTPAYLSFSSGYAYDNNQSWDIYIYLNEYTVYIYIYII